jgi:hypothetical protein
MINRIVGISIWLILWGGFYWEAAAQDTNLLFRRRFEAKRTEIEKIKKELITDRINLQPEQANKFWPIYDKYTQERLIVRRKLRVLNRGRNLTATDAEILEDIRQRSILRQQEVDLEKKTNEDLLKIINVRQLAELYFTEQEFLKRILQVLMGRAED